MTTQEPEVQSERVADDLGLVEVGVATEDGFVTAYLVRFGGTLLLRTHGRLHWQGREEHVRDQVRGLLDLLEARGFTVQGRDRLNEG